MTGKFRADTYDLLADIGGTNTRVALAEKGVLLRQTVRRFKNADFDDLDAVLRSYLAQHDEVDCAGAAVAIAGPVRDGIGSMTNLDWKIDQQSLARTTRAEKSLVINDLQAQAYALDRLDSADLTTIMPGRPAAPGATRLVIGIGTGFNAAPAYHTRAGLFVPPSEAGHADLPTRTDTEAALARHLARHDGGPAIEDLLSGRGLAQTYSFFAGTPVQAARDPAPEPATVIAAATTGTDRVATQALQHFATLLGRVAGDLALVHLPFGGVYLAGGVARAVAPFLIQAGFCQGFADKGRFSGFMSDFAVRLVSNDFAALHGCAYALAQAEPDPETGIGKNPAAL